MLLAVLTGRSDLCIAGVFGAGKTGSLAVLLIALSCEIKDFSAVIKMLRRKRLQTRLVILLPQRKLTLEGGSSALKKAKVRSVPLQYVRCSDRNRIISNKRILIATGGSAPGGLAKGRLAAANRQKFLQRPLAFEH